MPGVQGMDEGRCTNVFANVSDHAKHDSQAATDGLSSAWARSGALIVSKRVL
jgi:hypothetical protein